MYYVASGCSVITNLQLQINRYIRENDKQKYLKASFQHADFSASADFFACAEFSAYPHRNFHHNADC